MTTKLGPIKRHSVAIMRPVAATYDALGQLSGTDRTVADGVPCSIEQISGRERELARQNMAAATLRVRLFSDPAWSLTTGDYLLRDDSTRIEIGFIQDVDETQLEVWLTCAEEVPSI